MAADRRAKKGEIVHEAGASVSLARFGARYGFTIATKKRTFRLRCSSAEAAQRWIDSLALAWAPGPAEGVPPPPAAETASSQAEAPAGGAETAYTELVLSVPSARRAWPSPLAVAQRRLAYALSLRTESAHEGGASQLGHYQGEGERGEGEDEGRAETG